MEKRCFYSCQWHRAWKEEEDFFCQIITEMFLMLGCESFFQPCFYAVFLLNIFFFIPFFGIYNVEYALLPWMREKINFLLYCYWDYVWWLNGWCYGIIIKLPMRMYEWIWWLHIVTTETCIILFLTIFIQNCCYMLYALYLFTVVIKLINICSCNSCSNHFHFI